MFRTFKSRLAFVLSGVWIVGCWLVAERTEQFFPLLLIGWATIWGVSFGADWVLKAPGLETEAAGVDDYWERTPHWLRYGLLILLSGLVLGLAKAMSALAFR